MRERRWGSSGGAKWGAFLPSVPVWAPPSCQHGYSGRWTGWRTCQPGDGSCFPPSGCCLFRLRAAGCCPLCPLAADPFPDGMGGPAILLLSEEAVCFCCPRSAASHTHILTQKSPHSCTMKFLKFPTSAPHPLPSREARSTLSLKPARSGSLQIATSNDSNCSLFSTLLLEGVPKSHTWAHGVLL